MVPDPQVSVTIVTYNSARYICRCLEAVLEQDGIHFEILVVDNASQDDTLRLLQGFGTRIRLIRNRVNLGFAEGQNQAIRASRGAWILTLNPDALLAPGFLRTVVDAGGIHPRIGSVCGKLLSIGPGFEPLSAARIDSTGIYFTPSMRHFDRGWREPDTGRYDSPEYVFGASAAVALYRRSMIEDVSLNGSFFDPDFFSYREDADVAWRAQLQGWRCLYTPAATAYHVRTVLPDNRRRVPAVLNMHSVKNRFLMRVKNTTGGVFRRFWLPMLARDVMVLAALVAAEPRSLAALWHFARCLPRALGNRRAILARRKVSDEALARWFDFRPAARRVSEPATAISARLTVPSA